MLDAKKYPRAFLDLKNFKVEFFNSLKKKDEIYETSKSIKNKKILIIASHPDDEILGCGGMIAKLKRNNQIQVLFLTDGISARTKGNKRHKYKKNEALKLFKYLKIKNLFFLIFLIMN